MQDDGCTGFFDRIANLEYRICCDIHDTHLAATRDFKEFVIANREFIQCISFYDAFLAILMGLAVFSPIGVLLFIFGNKKEGV